MLVVFQTVNQNSPEGYGGLNPKYSEVRLPYRHVKALRNNAQTMHNEMGPVDALVRGTLGLHKDKVVGHWV